MAKKIRFPLKLKDGAEVRTLDELKENFDLESILGYFTDGKLVTWLADRYYDDKAEAVSALSADMPDLNAKLCEILEVEYQAEEDETDMELIARRREKLRILSSITDDGEILDNVDIVAMDQDELFDILDESPEKVYLYGEKFNIPSGKKNVSYVGINEPEVFLEKDKGGYVYKKLGIVFSNVKLHDDIMRSGEELFLSGKPQEAFPLIKEAAENGVPRAMYIMGLYYNGGYGTVKINKYERNKWYKNALPYNYPLSTLRYANDCLNSSDLSYEYSADFRKRIDEQQKKIFSQIVHEIEAMAEAGDVFAQAELGWIYYAGLGVEESESKSAEWYRKAADNGSAFAQTDLATIYYRGLGVPEDYYAAVELFKKAADQGFVRAQYNLSFMYKNGIGVSKNIDIANELLHKAVLQESEEALDKLIEINRDNDISPENDPKIIALLENLSEQGVVIAQYKLGEIYDSLFADNMFENEKLADEYLDKSDMWYEKAAEQGHAEAQRQLGIGRKPSENFLNKDEPKDYSASIKWFTKAAEQGHVSSQYELGEIYEKTNDRDKAVYWYKMAAENGWEKAIKKLKDMYGT